MVEAFTNPKTIQNFKNQKQFKNQKKYHNKKISIFLLCFNHYALSIIFWFKT